jgi:hypothetical protein
VGNSPAAFTAALSGLPAAATIHYRAVASSDFGTLAGADQTLTTSSPTPPPPGSVTMGRAQGERQDRDGRDQVHRRLLALALKLTARDRHHKVVKVGSPNVRLKAGQARIVRVSLNGVGRHLLAVRHVLKVKLTVQSLDGGRARTINTQNLIIKIHNHTRR